MLRPTGYFILSVTHPSFDSVYFKTNNYFETELFGSDWQAAAALFVLMGTLENSRDPKLLANTAKHFAFTRCSELNLYGMVDAQIAVVEGELLAGNTLIK